MLGLTIADPSPWGEGAPEGRVRGDGTQVPRHSVPTCWSQDVPSSARIRGHLLPREKGRLKGKAT